MQYLRSVCAAFIGIQSNSQQQHDFQNLSAKNLVVLAIALTILLVTALYFIVSLILG